jgi:hypothetical protein
VLCCSSFRSFQVIYKRRIRERSNFVVRIFYFLLSFRFSSLFFPSVPEFTSSGGGKDIFFA